MARVDPSGVGEDGGEADTAPGKWEEEEEEEEEERDGGRGGCVGCVMSLHEVWE